MDANELAREIHMALFGDHVITENDPVIASIIDVLHRANGWISVEERLPKNCADVLCMDSIGRYCIGHLTPSKDGWWIDERKVYLSYVTHWQPLPPAPEGER